MTCPRHGRSSASPASSRVTAGASVRRAGKKRWTLARHRASCCAPRTRAPSITARSATSSGTRLTWPERVASDLPPEFALIARHFRPLAGPGALGLRDDAAVLAPPPGRELVLTVDAMVGSVHFLPDDPPDLVGRKLLRVNLSDLAAKGAVPIGYLMTVSAPKDTPESWFAGFTAGLAQDQALYGVTLLGGDTTSTPGPISLSLTIIGHVAAGTAIRRSGFLLDRYRLPQPRIGLALAGIASAGMDVSDGLVQDLGHVCAASGVGAEIRAHVVPLSDAARAAGPAWLETCLTGGDDYELLLAVPADRRDALLAAASQAGIAVTCIG